MNERIKKLLEQVGLKHHNWITNESNVKDGDFKYPRLEDYEKFAQLIIQDCMEAVDGYTMARTFKTHYDAVSQIEALFGVKYEQED